MEEIKIHTAGDSSVLIEFGQEISPEINAKITAFVHLMKAQHVEGVKDMIPAFTSLLINYDPRVVNYGALKERLEKLLKLEVSQETAPSRISWIFLSCGTGRTDPHTKTCKSAY